MTQIDRNKILVRHLISKGFVISQKELGKQLGYGNESSFSQVINGKVAMPKDFTTKIKTLYPQINTDWLLSGEGEMIINTDNQPNEEAPPTDSIGGDMIKQALDQMRILVENNGKLVETNRQLVEANREQFDRMMQLLERHSRNKCDGRDCLAVSS